MNECVEIVPGVLFLPEARFLSSAGFGAGVRIEELSLPQLVGFAQEVADLRRLATAQMDMYTAAIEAQINTLTMVRPLLSEVA